MKVDLIICRLHALAQLGQTCAIPQSTLKAVSISLSFHISVSIYKHVVKPFESSRQEISSMCVSGKHLLVMLFGLVSVAHLSAHTSISIQMSLV
jgi:hypothetical protein